MDHDNVSSNLAWKPKETAAGYLPDRLKYVLAVRYGDRLTDGIAFSNANIQYLKGLMDAGVEGTGQLIDLIDKHGEIIVFEEH